MIIKARTPLGARSKVYTVGRNKPPLHDERLMISEDGLISNSFEVDTEACTLKVYLLERQPDGPYRAKCSPWVRKPGGGSERELLTATVKLSYDVVDRATGQVFARARL